MGESVPILQGSPSSSSSFISYLLSRSKFHYKSLGPKPCLQAQLARVALLGTTTERETVLARDFVLILGEDSLFSIRFRCFSSSSLENPIREPEAKSIAASSAHSDHTKETKESKEQKYKKVPVFSHFLCYYCQLRSFRQNYQVFLRALSI